MVSISLPDRAATFSPSDPIHFLSLILQPSLEAMNALQHNSSKWLSGLIYQC